MSERDKPDPPPSDVGGLAHHSTLVAAGILLSRVAGLVREVVTARLLGTGVAAEAFKAALRIPNLLQNLLGEGVLSGSFVPVYSRMLAEGRERDAGRLAGAVAGLLLALTSVLVVVGVVFAEGVTRLLTPGFVPGTERFELTVTLVRIVTPGIGLLVLSAWCLGILNTHRRFFLSYVAPVVWNVAIVVAVVAAALTTTTELTLARAMAWGALVGSILQLAVQLPAVRRHAPGLRLSLSLGVPGVRTVAGRFGQVLAGRGGLQLSSYVDLVMASLLAFGAVAALTYAQVLYLLPVALFGMSVAAAELPELSRMDHADRARVVGRLDAGLSRVAFFVAPAAVAFVLAGDLVVRTLLQGGQFSAEASVQVGLVLAAYAIGMPAATSSRLLQSALYGAGDARSPTLYTLLRVVVSTGIGIAAMLPLDSVRASGGGLEVVGEVGWSLADLAERVGPDNLLRLGAVGLALGASAGAWFELALLRQRVKILFGRVRVAGRHPRALAVGCAVAALVALACRWLLASTGTPPRLHGLIAVVSIGGAYLVAMRAQGVDEARELRRLLGRRTL